MIKAKLSKPYKMCLYFYFQSLKMISCKFSKVMVSEMSEKSFCLTDWTVGEVFKIYLA